MNGKLWPMAWFFWHPLLMIVAYVPLALIAVLIKKIGGYGNTKTHGIIMFIATLFTAASFYVIWSNKNMYNKKHFTSTHSIAGLVGLVFFYVVQSVGFLGLHPDFGFLRTNKNVRFAHKWAGKAAIVLGLVSLVFGFTKMDKSLVNQIIFSAPLLVFTYYALVV
jgi:hypothetical protein